MLIRPECPWRCSNRRFSDTTIVYRSFTCFRYRHENIISLCGCGVDGDTLCLVYQYMSNGSLYSCLQTKVGTLLEYCFPLFFNTQLTSWFKSWLFIIRVHNHFIFILSIKVFMYLLLYAQITELRNLLHLFGLFYEPLCCTLYEKCIGFWLLFHCTHLTIFSKLKIWK